MYGNLTVGAVIPANDEAKNIGAVVRSLLDLRTESGLRVIDDLVVCDNASTDATAQQAMQAGARVAREPTPGYGRACLTAIAALQPVDVVLFVDGDQAFDVRQSLDLLAPIATGADLVIGVPGPGTDGAGRPVGAAVRRQPRGEPVDPVAVESEDHRPGSVPGHSGRRAAAPGDAGHRLRLDGGDAGQGDPV